MIQKRFLVIHDVKALQAVGVKDQDSYKKTLAPSKCGSSFIPVSLGFKTLTTVRLA